MSRLAALAAEGHKRARPGAPPELASAVAARVRYSLMMAPASSAPALPPARPLS